jgi:hypothetical protein
MCTIVYLSNHGSTAPVRAWNVSTSILLTMLSILKRDSLLLDPRKLLRLVYMARGPWTLLKLLRNLRTFPQTSSSITAPIATSAKRASCLSAAPFAKLTMPIYCVLAPAQHASTQIRPRHLNDMLFRKQVNGRQHVCHKGQH